MIFPGGVAVSDVEVGTTGEGVSVRVGGTGVSVNVGRGDEKNISVANGGVGV